MIQLSAEEQQRLETWTETEQRIFRSLYGDICSVLPAQTVVRNAWAGIGFKTGDNWSCMVYPGKEGCNMMIYQGSKLSDRFGVLDGKGVSTRNFRARDLGYNKEALTDLLAQQQALYAEGIRWE